MIYLEILKPWNKNKLELRKPSNRKNLNPFCQYPAGKRPFSAAVMASVIGRINKLKALFSSSKNTHVKKVRRRVNKYYV